MGRLASILHNVVIATALALGAVATAAQAQSFEMREGGKLLLTHGVSDIEGAAGGGLATWAVIAGGETKNGVGADVHATYVSLPDFALRDYGVAVGLFDRIELSYARQAFDTGKTGAKLGLGSGFTFGQDVFGAKLKLAGDAVYDQDRWLPQIAVGAQVKHADQGAVIRAVGGRHADGTDVYIAATKVLLAQSLVLDATVRFTDANQTGLLGFGGDKSDRYAPQFEGSAAYLVSRKLVVGAEYRTKPDHLGFAREADWFDVFGAYAFCPHLSATLAYVDAGSIATFKNQRGVYVSLQTGF